jgi:hypothetical protein
LACQDEFFVNNLLDAKENDEHALDFAFHFPLRGLLLCLRVITINPALITGDNPGQEGCVIVGYLTNLLADVDMLLHLIGCQKSLQARYTTPIKGHKKLTRPPSYKKFLYTDSQYMLLLSSVLQMFEVLTSADENLNYPFL